MRRERMCPFGCPVALRAAYLQAQVFRLSGSVGEQLLVPLGGCCRVSRGCFGVEAGKVGGGGRSWLWAGPRAAKERGHTHK